MFKKQKIKLSKESYIKASKIFKFLKPQKSLFIIGFVFLLLSSLSSLIIPKYLGIRLKSVKNDELPKKIPKSAYQEKMSI